MDVRTRIKNRLKDYKASSGLTNTELAKELKISERTLYNYLRGDIANPSSKFTKNFKRRLYRRWKRSIIPLRNQGAVVDLSEYFRKVWFENGVFFTPYNTSPVPTYTFPPTAPVEILMEFEVIGIVDGVETVMPSNDGGAWSIRVENLRPNADIASEIEERFTVYYNDSVRSELQFTKIMKEKVLLRWLKNSPPPPMRERRMR